MDTLTGLAELQSKSCQKVKLTEKQENIFTINRTGALKHIMFIQN